MLTEFDERIQKAKDKQFMLMDRFHIGDTVYPFWLRNFIVYGTVIDIDTVARKIICDFNGVRRQFCPQDLMLVNPNLVQAHKSAKKASKVETHLSPDTDNGIHAICKQCGGEIAVSFNEQTGMTDFVCVQCGKRIPEDKLSQKSKKAMRKIAFREENKEKTISDINSCLQDIESHVNSIKSCDGYSYNQQKMYLFSAANRLVDLVQYNL